jgi:hypothetical protein
MVRAVLAVLLVAFVVWGSRTRPGRPFSWAMFSGSSKPFLFAVAEGPSRVPTFAELRLAPDSHYLVLDDLHALAREPTTPRCLRGLIVGTRGSWEVELDAGGEVVARELPAGEELHHLTHSVRRYLCPPR